jgi:hypothetical protein
VRLDGATLAIETRSVGECLDLAAVFFRAHAPRILGLTAVFAVPTCAWNFLVLAEAASVLGTLALFFVVSPFLGAVLVVASGRRAFGEPFRLRTALRSAAGAAARLLPLVLLGRLVIASGLLLGVAPGVVIAVRYGFVAEVLLLEEIAPPRLGVRLSDLLRAVLARLSLRLVVVCGFFALLAVSLFALLDVALGTLLGLPLLLQRLPADSELYGVELASFLLFDRGFSTALLAVLWLAYPVARLAWFFVYLDLRIRQECWDLELDFRLERRRLLSRP